VRRREEFPWWIGSLVFFLTLSTTKNKVGFDPWSMDMKTQNCVAC
jgi:hypothetical protein